MAALKRTFGLNVVEAWGAFRLLKDALSHAPGLIDLVRHPRITAREVRAARLALVKQEAIEVPVSHAEARTMREEREFYEDEYDETDLVEFELSADTTGDT